MENLVFDNGMKEYSINGRATLRFNPADPNLYNRFFDCVDKINEIEAGMRKEAATMDETSDDYAERSLRLMADADKKVKALLADTFGNWNDFEAIFDGVNVMGNAENGEIVIKNFMNLIAPIIEEGANRFVNQTVQAHQLNRQQRRAMQK